MIAVGLATLTAVVLLDSMVRRATSTAAVSCSFSHSYCRGWNVCNNRMGVVQLLLLLPILLIMVVVVVVVMTVLRVLDHLKTAIFFFL